jgi:nickel-dependent lactate racemase
MPRVESVRVVKNPKSVLGDTSFCFVDAESKGVPLTVELLVTEADAVHIVGTSADTEGFIVETSGTAKVVLPAGAAVEPVRIVAEPFVKLLDPEGTIEEPSRTVVAGKVVELLCAVVTHSQQ